ncbi:MAG: YdeI/OmpD-associated family protein [Chitinophagaceae bacterium]
MAIEYKTFYPKSRKAWRQWLEKNHSKSPGVWMVSYKKETGKPGVHYADAVEEALCFGWIDSIKNKLDEEGAIQKFSPRKPKSTWSELNKTRIKKLIEDGQMTAAGLSKIEEGKKNGSWNSLDVSNSHTDAGTLPADLEKAFSKNKKALENFKAFAPSYRRRFLFWIDSAKQKETRAARIKQTVIMSTANRKPGPKGFK